MMNLMLTDDEEEREAAGYQSWLNLPKWGDCEDHT
jgi:hypothetical protein